MELTLPFSEFCLGSRHCYQGKQSSHLTPPPSKLPKFLIRPLRQKRPPGDAISAPKPELKIHHGRCVYQHRVKAAHFNVLMASKTVLCTFCLWAANNANNNGGVHLAPLACVVNWNVNASLFLPEGAPDPKLTRCGCKVDPKPAPPVLCFLLTLESNAISPSTFIC